MLSLEERIKFREELRVKLETYDSIIRRLQNEKMLLWQQEIWNELEIKRLERGANNG